MSRSTRLLVLLVLGGAGGCATASEGGGQPGPSPELAQARAAAVQGSGASSALAQARAAGAPGGAASSAVVQARAAAAAPAMAAQAPAVAQARAAAHALAPLVVAPAGGGGGGGGAPVKVTAVEGIEEYRLANGLRVLLFPDASKPTFTVNLTVFVGSRHEGYGETGMAHLLEHMLFKGTPTHPDIWKLLQDRGAKFNGSTWFDRTNYYEELPAAPENLEFALRLEADRMINSRIAAEDLAKEFSVVRNEFEMGENSPPDVLEEKMFAAAFQWHNYGKSTIGSRTDIERVPVDNLRAFYRRFYQPDNALLVVAGKFEPARALELVDRSFGAIPRPTRQLPVTWTEEPIQDGERAVVLRRTGDVAVVAALYHAVAGADPDWNVFNATADVLTSKPSGRLYKALVEKGLASEVFGTVYPTAEPGVLFVGAKVRPGGSPEKVRDALLRTIEGLSQAPVAEAEVDRWRARSIREFELALTNTAQVGVALSDWAAMGDWRLFFHTRDRLKQVKAADVTRVAKAYLQAANRTVGMFIPTKTPERAPAPARIDVAALMKDFKSEVSTAEGEAFAATIENVEKRTTRQTLPGGLELALLPKKTKGAAVRVALTVRYGSEKDLKGKVTPANAIASMLMRGSRKHNFQELKDEFDRLKAEVRFGGGRFSVAIPGVERMRIKTVRENLPAVLTLVSEVLREPAFPAKEWETLRKEALARLEEERQDPMANGFRVLMQKMFPEPKGDVRYRPSVQESIDDLKRTRVADVARLHRALWGASTAQLSIVGDFDVEPVKALLSEKLASWKSARPFARVTQPFKEGLVEKAEVNTPDKEMAMVAVGHPLEVRDDDGEYPALLLINHILGGSASSRLLGRLRQKDGLSYTAFSQINARPDDRSGLFFAGAICAPQNADKAMAAMLEEIEKLLRDEVPAAELADAKRSYAAGWDGRIAEDDFVADELAQGLYLDRSFEHWRKINERIQSLTAAEVQAVARKYLKPDKLARVRAGDLSKKSS
jgi:zinc protease